MPVCLRNDSHRDVRNGTTGTITQIGQRTGSVTLDTDDGQRTLDPGYVSDGLIRHGYAVTVHKAQGRTVDHGLLLGTDDLYREAGYVGLSRGRHTNRIYIVSAHPDDGLERHGRRDRTDPSEVVLDSLHTSTGKELAINQVDIDHGADLGGRPFHCPTPTGVNSNGSASRSRTCCHAAVQGGRARISA